MMHVRATANLAKENKRPAVDIRKVLAKATVIGWQEMETWRHKRSLRRWSRRSPWRTWIPRGSAGAVPISYRADKYRILDRGKRLAHRGQRGVTPDRWVTWIVLGEYATGSIVAHVNTHTIAQAFTSHPERRTRWGRHAQVLEEVTAELYAKWGAVLGGGDLNRDGWHMPGADMHYPDHGTFGAKHYDALWSKGVTCGHPFRLSLLSDHDASLVVFERTPRSTG